MNQRIRDLRELSLLDAALRGLTERRKVMADAVQAAESALARAEAGLSSKRGEIRTLQKEADAFNLEIRSAEEHIAKLEMQRNAAKSNKEYEVFTREIDAAKETVSNFEDDALARLERVDEIAVEEESGRRTKEEAEASLASARGALAKADSGFASEEADLKAKREELAARVDPHNLALYGRILEMRKDSAMSATEDGSCGACARKLSPQTENLVTIGEEIVQCMSCSRILYFDQADRSP